MTDKDLRAAWTSVSGSASDPSNGPLGVLRDSKDNTKFSPESCANLIGLEDGTPFGYDDLDSHDPGYMGNVKSPSAPPPALGAVVPPSPGGYLAGIRLFQDEQKATTYFDGVVAALHGCGNSTQNYRGTAESVRWRLRASPDPNAVAWDHGGSGASGIIVRRQNIVMVAYTVTSTPIDVVSDARMFETKLGGGPDSVAE
ncbi:hypothetical protein [Sinomonas gamaensis]|uniref:hypothetical protein n=1 Tax=Sinomonas gamaensis TaxID=2565624 RepID=UPI0011091397|nr:hypothetical protein [Sinomonas gamaensis]